MLITNIGDPLASIVQSIYPTFLENMHDPSYFQHRAILSPKNDVVDMVNEYMLSLIAGEMKTYLSFDSTCSFNRSVDSADDVHTPEFLNTINSSGLSKNRLNLKVGIPIMSLRIRSIIRIMQWDSTYNYSIGRVCIGSEGYIRFQHWPKGVHS